MSSPTTFTSSNHSDSKDTNTSKKDNYSNSNHSRKLNENNPPPAFKEESSCSDNLESIINNLSRINENNDYNKHTEGCKKENLNNISDIIKPKKNQFEPIKKTNSHDCFVYNKITKNDKTLNASSNENCINSNNLYRRVDDSKNKMLNNGFIMNTSHSKGNIYNISDKEINKAKFTINKKIEKMIIMNENINKNNFYSTNEHKNNQVDCFCCQKK